MNLNAMVILKKILLRLFFELISKRTNTTYAKHCVMYKISNSNVNIYRKYYKSFCWPLVFLVIKYHSS